MDQEIWCTIPLGDRKYEVSNYGSIRRFYKGNKNTGTVDRYKPIQPNKHKKGYWKIGLGKTGQKSVHRLVALVFLPPVEGKMDVNHKDGIKTNNYYENLEWVTPAENNLHARNVLGIQPEKPVILLHRKCGRIFKEFSSESVAKRELGSLRGYLVIKKSLYTRKYANSILYKPRKKVVPRETYPPSACRKLTPEQVLEIRRLCAIGMRDYHVSTQIGCLSTTVKLIRLGKTYKEII